jgi:hypothetical protein
MMLEGVVVAWIDLAYGVGDSIASNLAVGTPVDTNHFGEIVIRLSLAILFTPLN